MTFFEDKPPLAYSHNNLFFNLFFKRINIHIFFWVGNGKRPVLFCFSIRSRFCQIKRSSCFVLHYNLFLGHFCYLFLYFGKKKFVGFFWFFLLGFSSVRPITNKQASMASRKKKGVEGSSLVNLVFIKEPSIQ